MLCAPIKHGNKIDGVINIEIIEQEKSTSEDMRLLSLLATLTAMAISNARLYAKTVELANTDGLTKLYNNRFFQQFLENEIKKCMKTGKKPIADMYVGKRAVEMIEAAIKSTKEGRKVEMK